MIILNSKQRIAITNYLRYESKIKIYMSGLELYIVLLPIVVGILGIQFELHKIRKLLENNEENLIK